MEYASPSNVNLADSRTILSFGQIDICSGEKVACDVQFCLFLLLSVVTVSKVG